jgi:hypothetical protein
MTLTKEQARKRIHSLRCRSAARRRVNSPTFDREAAGERMRAGLWRKYESLVDPLGVLPEEERAQRARKLWSAEMDKAKADKLQKRLRSLRGEVEPTVLSERSPRGENLTEGKTMGPQITVRLNNAATNDPCAVCGKRTDPQIGPELFLKDTWALVCRQCGKQHAPELVEFLDDYRAWAASGQAQ